MTSSAILGDWTHRRGDRGGSRAVAAEIDQRARPDDRLVVAARARRPGRPGARRRADRRGRDDDAARRRARREWEHAVVYVLDARTGRRGGAPRAARSRARSRRWRSTSGIVHVVATRRGEPIFWYALTRGRARAAAPPHRGDRRRDRPEDVLDAWATPAQAAQVSGSSSTCRPRDGASRVHAYAFVEPGGAPAAILMKDRHAVDRRRASRARRVRRAAASCSFRSRACGAARPTPSRRRSRVSSLRRLRPRRPRRGRARGVFGPHAQIHALGAEGMICGVAMAEEPGRPERGARRGARHRSRDGRRCDGARSTTASPSNPGWASAARVARRPNGELLFQSLSADGEPCTPLLCARPDGQLDELLLGARGRHVLDAALGDLVLAHREDKRRGRRGVRLRHRQRGAPARAARRLSLGDRRRQPRRRDDGLRRRRRDRGARRARRARRQALTRRRHGRLRKKLRREGEPPSRKAAKGENPRRFCFSSPGAFAAWRLSFSIFSSLLGRDSSPQLDAHLVEARRQHAARPAQEEVRVVDLRVVGRKGDPSRRFLSNASA